MLSVEANLGYHFIRIQIAVKTKKDKVISSHLLKSWKQSSLVLVWSEAVGVRCKSRGEHKLVRTAPLCVIYNKKKHGTK